MATRGGEMRIKIIKSIKENPKNANQLSRELGVNYRTIEHHMKILEENNLVTVQGSRYGKVYFISTTLDKNLDIVLRVFEDVKMKGGKN